eukprot:2265591-Prymnesium_polylepis.1
MAHALHDMIMVQNMTEIEGPQLLQTLITRVRFEGVTGVVAFNDASAGNFKGHGDRTVGISYTISNHMGEPNGLMGLGLWSPCANDGCSWPMRWRPATDGAV